MYYFTLKDTSPSARQTRGVVCAATAMSPQDLRGHDNCFVRSFFFVRGGFGLWGAVTCRVEGVVRRLGMHAHFTCSSAAAAAGSLPLLLLSLSGAFLVCPPSLPHAVSFFSAVAKRGS